MEFPVSGVECSPLLPPFVAFTIASLVTSAGVSGAFLILPFQMSVLGFTSPAVSATNLLYNIIAIPGGVSQYIREGRMTWPIVWSMLCGTLPGMFVGAVIRVRFLPRADEAKLFVGVVLAWLGYRLLRDYFFPRPPDAITQKFRGRLPKDAVVRTVSVSLRRVEYEFWGEPFAFNPLALGGLGFVVGIAGGIYGIGGGAIIAPFIVSVFALPIYTIGGATLFGTLVTSIAGVGFFQLLASTSLSAGVPVRPDWLLGALFGIGGLAGTFVGARLQKYLPERWIRLFLGVLVAGLALNYMAQFFL